MTVLHGRAVTRAVYVASYKASKMRTSLIDSKGIVPPPAPLCSAHCNVFSTARLPVCSSGSLCDVSINITNILIRFRVPMTRSLDDDHLTSFDQIVSSVVE